MNKKILISLIIIGIIIFGGLLLSKLDQHNDDRTIANNLANNSSQMPRAEITVDRIEVVHFHAAQQCWACITVGEYALKTIEEKFPEEYKNGTIVFKNINSELPENKDIVIKYQARGSALFINTIANGEDEIEEDVAVWRFVTNEGRFVSYFENKLSMLLIK